ncbi:hypothetical protein EGT74_14300 [Chitinophaga lutea]|uniref:Outer membrane protein beta-barrel domain-containing protein n=1 Tax=Chitinophaga lutea TaxID=2488634 RepID=A0A3N4PT94_9BACT|nr:hypothetical protein [Chitinophaga lutea]RPE08231.1 hypothetical protein EGT74_14300 [Chitinophaga lutea]
MKKNYLLSAFTATLLLATASSLLAQEAPHKKFFVGASFGVSSTKSEQPFTDGAGNPRGMMELKSTDWHVAPQFGWFLRERFAIGVEGFYRRESNPGANLPTKSIGAGVFGRLLVPVWSSRFSIYNDLVLSGARILGYTHDGTALFQSKTNMAGLYYRPGLQFRLKSNINLLASMGNVFGYTYRVEKKDAFGSTIEYPSRKNTSHTVGFYDKFSINSFSIGANFLF